MGPGAPGSAPVFVPGDEGATVPGFWIKGRLGSRTMTSGSCAREGAAVRIKKSTTGPNARRRARRPVMEEDRSAMSAAPADDSRFLRRLRLLEVDHRDLQVVEKRLEQPCFVRREVSPGLHLEGLEEIDDLPRAVEIDLDLACERVGHLAEIGRSR